MHCEIMTLYMGKSCSCCSYCSCSSFALAAIHSLLQSWQPSSPKEVYLQQLQLQIIAAAPPIPKKNLRQLKLLMKD